MGSALSNRLLESHERAQQASTDTILAPSSSPETISKSVSLGAGTMTVTQIISTVSRLSLPNATTFTCLHWSGCSQRVQANERLTGQRGQRTQSHRDHRDKASRKRQSRSA